MSVTIAARGECTACMLGSADEQEGTRGVCKQGCQKGDQRRSAMEA